RAADRRSRALNAGDPRAPARGRRPRADLRRHRRDCTALPLLRLQPRPGARLRRPRGAPGRVAFGGALAELPQASARAGGGRGPPERPTATGTCAGIQDPRTREQAEEETLSPLRVREDAVDFALPDPGRRLREVVLGQE